MVLLLQQGRSSSDIENALQELNTAVELFTLHECKVSRAGLSTFQSKLNDFDINWLCDGAKN